MFSKSELQCYAVDTENVQSLCLHVCVSAQHLVNETLACIALRNTTVSKIHLTTVLNSLFAVVSRLVDELKNLMNWLDRSFSLFYFISFFLTSGICVTLK